MQYLRMASVLPASVVVVFNPATLVCIFVRSRVLAYYMYEKSFSEYGFRMGYGAAIAVILFLIMMIYITFFLMKMYRDEKEN